MQEELFSIAKPANGLRDSAFAKNKEIPVHRWVPWIAGFSAGFVVDCLDRYLRTKDGSSASVLDPFAGVGTTLVEAFMQGLDVTGFEINPYAALAVKSKLTAIEVSCSMLAEHIRLFRRFMDRQSDGRSKAEPRAKPPSGFSGRTQLFSPKVERKVLFALDFINSIQNSKLRDLFRLALGSMMVSVSNYSYEPSRTRRSAVDKPDIEDAPVAVLLCEKLNLMLDDIEWLQRRMRAFRRRPEAKVIHDSIFCAPAILDRKGFVDLVITSPPYLNNYHYPRNTRPQLHWLGLASGPGYNGAGQDKSFGKFWQSVRDLPAIDLSFHFPELSDVIATIRKLNSEKGHYGGEGWGNYVATYFNDTHRFCSILAELLRPKGAAVVVLGNSIIQGVEVKTDYFFGRIAELNGLSFEDTVLLRKKRTGSSIIQSSVRVDKAESKAVLYEAGIVLTKRHAI